VNARAIQNVEASRPCACLADGASIHGCGGPAGAYRQLTGVLPGGANIDSDDSFDRHVLACIVALASTEKGPLAAQVGLSATDLAELLTSFFPNSSFTAIEESEAGASVDFDEMEIVRDLLLANRSSTGECGQWLAAMVARRALEANHLWEDLGLRDRSELTRLIGRHFAPLALRNDKNMRWKRFLYRMMCEDDGFVMCSTPVCTNCADYALCYGEETGTSRLAKGPTDPAGATDRGM
jgi:nitrogen fixation protein NifQ